MEPRKDRRRGSAEDSVELVADVGVDITQGRILDLLEESEEPAADVGRIRVRFVQCFGHGLIPPQEKELDQGHSMGLEKSLRRLDADAVQAGDED